MAEYVISEDEYRSAMRKAYEAGAAGREVYTARDYLTRPLVRCRDCRYFASDECALVMRIFGEWFDLSTVDLTLSIDPDGYCAWGERRKGA